MPGQALRVPGVWGSHIFRQSAHEGGKVVSSTHRPPLHPRKRSLVIMAIVRQEGSSQRKIPVIPAGNKHATVRLVAQPLNQLRHCVPALVATAE